MVTDLGNHGSVCVDTVLGVPFGEMLMYSAHGVSSKIREETNHCVFVSTHEDLDSPTTTLNVS